MTDQSSGALLNMTVGIVANYLANNRIGADEVGALITATHSALANVGTAPVEPDERVARPSAAQIRKSISDQGLVSFLDGKTYQSLRRHLSTRGFTPDSYRETFGLRSDYPMVSPAYSAQRSALAKALGLGQGGRKPKTQTPPPKRTRKA